jgi:hypothetical protein
MTDNSNVITMPPRGRQRIDALKAVVSRPEVCDGTTEQLVEHCEKIVPDCTIEKIQIACDESSKESMAEAEQLRAFKKARKNGTIC